MAKQNLSAESIYNIKKHIKPERIQPIYFLFGEDDYTISHTIKLISDAANTFIETDFDREIITASKEIQISHIVDTASAFPFGSSKKLLTVKGFENINDKKKFADYAQNPVNSTILIITQHGKKLDCSKEPYTSLAAKGFLFEAKELKGQELVNWTIRQASELQLVLSQQNAEVMVDLVGDSKSLIEMQLYKFQNYLNKPNSEIPLDLISSQVRDAKEFNIFNLQDALGKGKKGDALNIAYNLLENGQNLVYIITMLAKYFSILMRILEFLRLNTPDFAAAKECGVSPYYYINCKKSKYLLNEARIDKSLSALLEADIQLKSTNADEKALVTILVSKICG
ncbi:MAG: DNA polymerase III subunit delta [Bacteroidetes bacterium]|nr:DNA polymerase III subunit delta [Bacteroidota bacterium]MBU2505707.1 DNA polymerase III subunit delta [Bacteroidota bacterium]